MFKSILLGTLLCTSFVSSAADVVLFRHAEKQDGTDPSLTTEGNIRAERIANLLAPLSPTALYATNYNRTQQTIAPLAKKTRLQVLSYNPRQLEAFAESLREMKGVVVVAGHSNTTPELVKLLSGTNWPIDESTFDDLFILKQTEQGFKFNHFSSNNTSLAEK
ncbi:histidine phosphatase family protein (plasmid) [Pseudoalteromonas xiamenensis]|uniref:SixA phosphatase family protein n=1 Tax=Pseudoalteromonas xiamenensis TaxID=882626 RepID=UPI0027E54F1A|nr:histidine phosphatase family protein [Pseudoalteromonas xiamenensis]WMN61705.1 histidine phosphatase family protein [Pseudoalteromonas xiamenensis]